MASSRSPFFTHQHGYFSEDRRSLLHRILTGTGHGQLAVIVHQHTRWVAALEAAEWFVRIDDDCLSHQDRTRYLGWLKKSPIHVAEMLRLVRVCEQLRSALSAQLGPSSGRSNHVASPTPVDVRRHLLH